MISISTLSAAALDEGLIRAARFVRGTAKVVTAWAQLVARCPNELAAEPHAEASMRAGGDPNICYFRGILETLAGSGARDSYRGA